MKKKSKTLGEKALEVLKRIESGEEKTIPWSKVKKRMRSKKKK